MNDDNPCCEALKKSRDQIVEMRAQAVIRQMEIWRYYGENRISESELAMHLDNLLNVLLGDIPAE